MGKILTTFGPSGTCKSTFAINLAEELASRGKLVGIIDCDINTGGAQIFFGEIVEGDLGIFNALNDKAETPDKFLKQIKRNRNIYILSCPNDRRDFVKPEFDHNSVETIIRNLAKGFDYLILDGTSDFFNSFTLLGLFDADHVFMCYKPSTKCAKWHNAHIGTVKRLARKAKIVNIVNEHDVGIPNHIFSSEANVNIDVVLPDIPNASFLEDQGTAIWHQKGKIVDRYKLGIRQIADMLIK